MPIDWSFIFQKEGRILKGYVPTENGEPIQNSGVTVATGCDIGQMTSEELRSLNLPQSAFIKLNPYTNITREKAVAKLKQIPLELTDDEAKALDEALHNKILGRFKRNFELASNTKFSHLPDEAQTVLASLAINWGPNFHRTHPETWDLLIKKNWGGVIQRFKRISKRDPLYERRQSEAKLLSTIA